MRKLTISDLADEPSTSGSFTDFDYDWDRQSRVNYDGMIIAGSKQTFQSDGKPYDSTDGHGATLQTFKSDGTPYDKKDD